jgi:hypothetical protein
VCRDRRGQQDRKDQSGPRVTPARQDKGASPVLKDQPGRLALLGPSERKVTPAIGGGRATRVRRAARVLQVLRGVQGTLGRLDRPVLSGEPVAGAIPVRLDRQDQRDRLGTLARWVRRARWGQRDPPDRLARRVLKGRPRPLPAPLVRLVQLGLPVPQASRVLRVSPVLAASRVPQANKVCWDQPDLRPRRGSGLAIGHRVPDCGYQTPSAFEGNMPSAVASSFVR